MAQRPETPPPTAGPLPPAPGSCRQTERASLAAILLLCLGTLAVFPWAAEQGPAIPGLTAFFAGILLMGHGCVAWLVIALARADGNPAILLLGLGYLASAFLAAPYMAVFPEALVPTGPLFGTSTSASWLFTGLNLATGLPSLAAALLVLSGPPPFRSRPAFDRLTALAIPATLVAAALVTAIALRSDSWLPPLVSGDRFTPFYMMLNAVIIALHALAAFAMLALRGRIPVFAWAAVAHVAAALAHIGAAAGGMRFSIGWTYARISYTFAALVVLIYFLTLFTRQQRALAAANDLLEARVAARTVELASALSQRDTLLREVYHRVRNNLAIVDSLAHFQLRAVASPDGRAALADMRTRVQALALLHEQLIEPIVTDKPMIELARFIETLCAAIDVSAGAAERGITIEARVAPVHLPPEVAAPLGMIISELVTNALRHAFPEGGGNVRLLGYRSAEGYRLAVEDSGTTSGAFLIREGKGLGSQIVRALARQLGATLTVDQKPGAPVRTELMLPHNPSL